MLLLSLASQDETRAGPVAVSKAPGLTPAKKSALISAEMVPAHITQLSLWYHSAVGVLQRYGGR